MCIRDSLKPAWEPIVVAMKPLDGTFAANAEKWGVAGLNIDGGRIGTESHIVHGKEAGKFQPCGGETKKDYHEVQGRFPANVILDEEAAAMLDEQSGERSAGHYSGKVPEGGGLYKLGLKPMPDRGYTETGGASRFFYCAKASRAERNAGLEGIEAVRRADRNKADGVGGDNPRNRTNTLKQNHHPTVKPLKLMEHLCELTKTPTGGVVLDCFGGSGTTGVACVNTGRDYVIIEKEPEYAEIARRRIEYAKEQNSGQMALFGANK